MLTPEAAVIRSKAGRPLPLVDACASSTSNGRDVRHDGKATGEVVVRAPG